MPDALLLPGEQVLLITRRHLLTLLLPLLLLFAGGGALALLACPTALHLRLNGRCPLLLGVAVGTAALVLFVDWYFTRFVLTDQRLLRLRTPLWQRVHALSLPGLESLTVEVGLLGRLLGFGTILADTAATQGGRLVLDTVPDPEGIARAIAGSAAAARQAVG
ncbi:MAG: PH domain-containing protein [Armatimonadota bacterium]